MIRNIGEVPGICFNTRTLARRDIYSPEAIADVRAEAISYITGRTLTDKELIALRRVSKSFRGAGDFALKLKIPYKSWHGIHDNSETWGSKTGPRNVTLHLSRVGRGLVSIRYAERADVSLPPSEE
jgi:hypothetical protein